MFWRCTQGELDTRWKELKIQIYAISLPHLIFVNVPRFPVPYHTALAQAPLTSLS
jgi:hypothetical protein